MSDYVLYTDHIMYQPIFACSLSCDGCYLHASKSAKYDGPLKTDIVDLIFDSRRVACSQFTLSLDTVNPRLEKFKPLRELLVRLFKYYKNESTWLPDLCITAHNLNTIRLWATSINMTLEKFLAPIYLLSLSTFPVLGKQCSELQEVCQQTNTKLNFNTMVSDEKDWEISKSFEMGCRYADQIYLVLKKAPLGLNQNSSAFRNWLKARKFARENYSNKLHEDVCVLDSIHYNQTFKPCGAGTKKIHVWPNGRVSSCPYDSGQVHRPLGSENMYTEVRNAISNSECAAMAFCTIPNMIKDLSFKHKHPCSTEPASRSIYELV